MAITTATELKTALGNWLNRTDLGARLDEFIVLAESRLNRQLRVRGMEASMLSTALVAGATALPVSFLAFKELRGDYVGGYTLEPRPLEWIRNQGAAGGFPGYYAVTNTQVLCYPGDGSVMGTYYQALPSLSSNAVNWLLSAHPDLYLMACLEEAAVYTRNEKLGVMAGTRAQGVIDSLQSSDNANAVSGGPLVVRVR